MIYHLHICMGYDPVMSTALLKVGARNFDEDVHAGLSKAFQHVFLCLKGAHVCYLL